MMMAITIQDLLFLTRYCAGFGPCERLSKCRKALDCVQEAACFKRITGRVHPFYGDGSLSGLLLRYRPENVPFLIDIRVLNALAVVLLSLLEAFEKRA